MKESPDLVMIRIDELCKIHQTIEGLAIGNESFEKQSCIALF